MQNPQTRPGYVSIDSWSRGREPQVDWNNRDSIIRWLVWNDPNGSYTDAASRAEDMPPLTLDEARQYMIEQTTD